LTDDALTERIAVRTIGVRGEPEAIPERNAHARPPSVERVSREYMNILEIRMRVDVLSEHAGDVLSRCH
jgi:hypothetical protein